MHSIRLTTKADELSKKNGCIESVTVVRMSLVEHLPYEEVFRFAFKSGISSNQHRQAGTPAVSQGAVCMIKNDR